VARKAEYRSVVRQPQQKLNIFISYASEDKQLVAGIASEIKTAFPLSLEVHRDEDFKLGENWKDDIENGLDMADILLVIFTDRPKPSFSFTGYEIGYFNSSIKARPNIRDGLKRVFIPLLIGDAKMPDTMYYVQGAKLDGANSIKIAETSAEKQNDEAWSKNPRNPIVTLLNRISDLILDFSGTVRTQEILATIQETISKAATRLYGDIHRYLQSRIFREIFPERKIVIKSDTLIEFEPDGANLNDCRVELLGKSFDSFGIPEYVSASREFTWADFLARMDPTAIGPWREGIRLLVSSVLEGSGDNYMVISTIQKDIAYRLFVSRVVTYVSKETEIHIYVVEIKSREYGDKETTQLLKAVSVGLRFRFLVLEQDSEFTPQNLGFPIMTLDVLKPKIAELLSQMNLILRDANQAGLQNPQILRRIWSGDADKVQDMMTIWERARRDLYSTADAVLHATDANFADKKAAFIGSLTKFCEGTETMNREFTAKVMHLLAETVAQKMSVPVKVPAT
jgi:TIR domain